MKVFFVVLKYLTIVNWLITRACNLKCSYCRLIKNPKEWNGPYPVITKFTPLDKLMRIVDKIKSINPDSFIIVYGGEPTLHPQLEDFLKYLHKIDLDFTIITNAATEKQRKRLEKLIQEGVVKRLTCSVDIVSATDNSSRFLKAQTGYKFLKEMKEKYPHLDAVAEVVVDVDTVNYLEDTVLKLSESGIYSSISVVETAPTKYYDFAETVPEEKLIKPNTPEYEIFKNAIEKFVANPKKYLVHMPDMLLTYLNYLPMNVDCKIDDILHNLTIDSDGTVRLCLRIRGRNPLDFETASLEELQKWIAQEKKDLCKGCAWTCPLMSQKDENEIKYHRFNNKNQEGG